MDIHDTMVMKWRQSRKVSFDSSNSLLNLDRPIHIVHAACYRTLGNTALFSVNVMLVYHHPDA